MGHYGRVAPRSGLAYKYGIDVLAGVIDVSYRGEIKVILNNCTHCDGFIVKKGDKIAQLILEKCSTPQVRIVAELSDTDRGEGGFGSTDGKEPTSSKFNSQNHNKGIKVASTPKKQCFFHEKGGCHPLQDMGQMFGDEIYVCHNHRNLSSSQFDRLNRAFNSQNN